VFALKGEQTRIANTLTDSQDLIFPHDKTGKPNKKLIQNLKSIMTGFASSNEAIEQRQMTIEEIKINARFRKVSVGI
jgi:hypothetical protein